MGDETKISKGKRKQIWTFSPRTHSLDDPLLHRLYPRGEVGTELFMSIGCQHPANLDDRKFSIEPVVLGLFALLREEREQRKGKGDEISNQDHESKVRRRIKSRSPTSKKGSIEAKVRSRSDREAT